MIYTTKQQNERNKKIKRLNKESEEKKKKKGFQDVQSRHRPYSKRKILSSALFFWE